MTIHLSADNRDDIAAFVTARPRLQAIAVSVLRDVGEAEDVVQDAWLRWERTSRSEVRSPSAFLAVTVTRLAINVFQSAHRRRETPVGSASPDAVDDGVGPDTQAERHEAVHAAIRLMLEKLTPAERAAYLLRVAFDYPYRRISEVLRLNDDHARQLVRRARVGMAVGCRRRVDEAVHRRLVRTFMAAARSGDLGELENLLAADMITAGSRPGPGSRSACDASSGSRRVPSAAR